MVYILGEHSCAHYTAVQFDVLGEPYIACLNEFLGDDSFTGIHQVACYVTCHIGFSGIGVNA